MKIQNHFFLFRVLSCLFTADFLSHRVSTVCVSGRLNIINLNVACQTFEVISSNRPLTQTVLTHHTKYISTVHLHHYRKSIVEKTK